jgi:hypothetical protein
MRAGPFAGLALLALTASPAPARSSLSDAQIRQKIIEESIEQYPGNCPCPYNVARNGSRCGARSAYSRAGGYAPYCYAGDVSAAEVRQYRLTR